MSEKKPYCYKYPRPAVTVDCVILNKIIKDIRILLIKRKFEPFKGQWALPGGFLDMNETTEEAAKRELKEETGILVDKLEQIHTFSDIKRDPRGRTISVVYFSFFNDEESMIKAGDDAKEVCWHSLNNLPELAFDHKKIVKFTIDKIK